MKCPKCYTENTEGSRFCSSCAAPLTGTENAQPSFTKTIETPLEKLTRGSLFAGHSCLDSHGNHCLAVTSQEGSFAS